MNKFTYAITTSLLNILSIMACLGIIGWGSSALAEKSSLDYGGDKGGSTLNYLNLVELFNHSGETLRIEGVCKSACTMFLGIKNVCVDRNATLLFHQGQLNTPATGRMLAQYNERLKKYLKDNGIMGHQEFHSIPGKDIIEKFGYRECPPKKRG
ncbi:MAG TPA: hypothetical protein VK438_14270 [Xanthobacteraceae bacterium]|nr:hypothetical protein [Xanthobacteraceae bacterium]